MKSTCFLFQVRILIWKYVFPSNTPLSPIAPLPLIHTPRQSRYTCFTSICTAWICLIFFSFVIHWNHDWERVEKQVKNEVWNVNPLSKDKKWFSKMQEMFEIKICLHWFVRSNTKTLKVSLHTCTMFIFGSKVVQTGCNECDLFSRTKNAKKLWEMY